MEDLEEFKKTVKNIKENIENFEQIKDENSIENEVESESETTIPNISLLFTQKKRIMKSTEFKYFSGHHEGNATERFINILNNTIQKIINKNIISNFSEDSPDDYVLINLNNVDNWEHYETAINNVTVPNVDDLKTLKSSLNNFILARKNEIILIGQIKRLYPRQVLLDTDTVSFMFNNNIFNDVEIYEDRVEIEDDFDVFFILIEDLKLAIVKNQKTFNDIFDMHDQIKNEALEVVSTSNLYEFFDNKEKIIEIIESDRTVQNMLRNPITSEAFAEITMENLLEAKSKLENLADFEINNGNIKLSSEKEKESLKCVIKTAGHCYNAALYGSDIIEGRPTKKLT